MSFIDSNIQAGKFYHVLLKIIEFDAKEIGEIYYVMVEYKNNEKINNFGFSISKIKFEWNYTDNIFRIYNGTGDRLKFSKKTKIITQFGFFYGFTYFCKYKMLCFKSLKCKHGCIKKCLLGECASYLSENLEASKLCHFFVISDGTLGELIFVD